MIKNTKSQNINLFTDKKISLNINDFIKINLTKNKNVKKILIIKWGGMGDIIQAMPIIDSLVYKFEFAEFHLNTLPAWKELFQENNKIKKIWGNKFRKGVYGISDVLKWLKIVKNENYDLIVDLQTNDRSRILISLLRLSFMAPKYIIGNHQIFPYTIHSDNKIFIDDPFNRMERTISTIGVKSSMNHSIDNLTKKSSKKAINLLKKNNLLKQDYVIFMPGGSKSNPLKRWGVKNYVKLSKIINHKIILIGGPDDETDCKDIRNQNKNIINFCSKLSLPELIKVFEKAKFIIANDTGPTHLAATTNTPIIQILGPTDPSKVKPIGGEVISIQSNIECKNCYKKECSHHSCMKDISPEFISNLIKKNYVS